MVEGVGAGLAVVELRRWNPFGAPVGRFAGDPALFGQSVVGFAGKGQIVDVGAPAGGPLGDVVDFALVAGRITTGGAAATVFGVTARVMR